MTNTGRHSTPAIPHPTRTALVLVLVILIIMHGAVMLAMVMLAAVRWLNWWVS